MRSKTTLLICLLTVAGCYNHIDLRTPVYLSPDSSLTGYCLDDPVCYHQRLQAITEGFFYWFNCLPEDQRPTVKVLMRGDDPPNSNVIHLSIHKVLDDPKAAGLYTYDGFDQWIEFTRDVYDNMELGVNKLIASHEFGHALLEELGGHPNPADRLSVMNTPPTTWPTEEDCINFCLKHQEIKYCAETTSNLPER